MLSGHEFITIRTGSYLTSNQKDSVEGEVLMNRFEKV